MVQLRGKRTYLPRHHGRHRQIPAPQLQGNAAKPTMVIIRHAATKRESGQQRADNLHAKVRHVCANGGVERRPDRPATGEC